MRLADCHPDKKHRAFGLCNTCYAAKYRNTDSGKRKIEAYRNRQDFKAKMKAKRSTREYKDKRNQRLKSPENRLKSKLRNSKPQAVQRRLEHGRSEQGKKQKRNYQCSIKAKMKTRIRHSSPEYVSKKKHYYLRNKHKFRTIGALLRVKRRMASRFPSFMQDIEAIYKNKPKGYEVDHIIPIVNPEVCGLHTPWNLQYLTRKQNRFKSNKFDGTSDNNSWIEEFKLHEKE